MTAAPPLDPERREALARDYVLGTLDAAAAAEAEAAAAVDRDLAEAVAAWEARLAGLATAVPEAAPSDRLWSRIEASVAAETGAAPRAPAAAAGVLRRLRLWQGIAAAAAAAAVVLAVAVVRPPPATPPGPAGFVAVLAEPAAPAAPAGQPAFVVRVDGAGAVRVSAVRPPDAPGRSLQLWTLRTAAEGPVPLGLLGPDGSIEVPAAGVGPVAPGQLFEVTAEPPGGSPTGRPTGPILGLGRAAPSL
jgi:anti-sigma-K factor RskA